MRPESAIGSVYVIFGPRKSRFRAYPTDYFPRMNGAKPVLYWDETVQDFIPNYSTETPNMTNLQKLADKIEDLINYIIDRRMGLGGAVPLIEETKKEIAQLLEE